MNSESNIKIAGTAIITVKVDGWSSDELSRLERVIDDYIALRNNCEVKPEPKKAAPKKQAAPTKKHTWSEDEKQEVFRRYQSGELAKKIAADFGVTLQSIRQLLYANRIKKDEAKPVQTVDENTIIKPVEKKDEKQRKEALREYRKTTPKPYYLK